MLTNKNLNNQSSFKILKKMRAAQLPCVHLLGNLIDVVNVRPLVRVGLNAFGNLPKEIYHHFKNITLHTVFVVH